MPHILLYTNIYRIIHEDSNYSMKVVAICSEGFMTEFTIEEPVSVDNIVERVYIFLIISIVLIIVILEPYLGIKFSNFVSCNQKISVENV